MKVWGMKKWSGFGKSARHGHTYTNAAPSAAVLRLAEAAAAGEYKSKAMVIAGRTLLADQARGDGWWSFTAKNFLNKKVAA
jgi:hypothetical protein